MDVLQRALNQALADLPALFLEKLISKKLQQQGLTSTKILSAKIAKHILSGESEQSRHKNRKHSGNVTLSFSEADADEVARAIDSFGKTQLPNLLVDVAHRMSRRILRKLKSDWAKENALQQADLLGFHERLQDRWGKPLGQLRMLLTMAREWGQAVHDRPSSTKTTVKELLPSILTRLHVRACQVTDEIICLLENGFADGAMARWRTLHEIGVVAAVLHRHGEEITKRYLAHQAVESKRAMKKYMACYAPLGYKPLSARAVKKVTKAYDEVIARYGNDFDSDYGWATHHLKKKRVTFADLETDAGRAEMRSYYQMGNDNIHAGVKSMYIRLGLVNYDGLLAGRSNFGLVEPGQNAAHTLTQISVLVYLREPNLDDLTVADMMRTLRDEIPRSLARAHMQLRKDDKRYRAAG
jgi:Family of unknown function (DUF5677)